MQSLQTFAEPRNLIFTGTAGVDVFSHAAGLARVKCPWILGDVEWSGALEKQAVIWLAKRLKKPISKLQEEDYWQHNVHVSVPYSTSGLMPLSWLRVYYRSAPGPFP